MADPIFYIHGPKDEHPDEQLLAVADRIYQKMKWSKIAKTALLRTPDSIDAETRNVRNVKRKLSDIRTAGYPIEPYSNMSRDELIGYLSTVRSDIKTNARRICPDTLREIAEESQEQRDLTWV